MVTWQFTKLWQGLPTLPLRRPKVSNAGPRRETFGPEDGGVGRPAPNRLELTFPATAR